MKSHFKKYPDVPQEVKDKIIERWRFSKLNSIPTIASEFNVPISQIDKIINDYLSIKCKSLQNN